MKLKCKPTLSQIDNEQFVIRFLETGDVFEMTSSHSQINMLRGNILDGMVANIYMKLQDQTVTPLLGVHSPSTFSIHENKAYYTGKFRSISYQIILFLEDNKWVYDVILESTSNDVVTLYYGQDLAIQNQASVLNSEPYTSQYIDSRAFDESNGYVLLARQNQGTPQICQIGSTSKITSYATDGYQFFGPEYKRTNVPRIGKLQQLPSEIYQYEFTYFALQTEQFELSLESKRISFYGYYQPDVKEIMEKPVEVLINHHPTPLEVSKENTFQKGSLQNAPLLNGLEQTTIDMMTAYPNRRHEEYDDDELLSFFTDRHHHVVLMQKDMLVERAHGNLMIHGDIEHASKDVMATTNFIFGVFHSHIVTGNSSFNKFLGDVRNQLNLQKMAGLRIYIKRNGAYHLLGMPSYYDMGVSTTTWTYILEDDTITVTASVDIDNTIEYLSVNSNQGYELLVQMHVLMNSEEFLGDVPYELDKDTITFHPADESLVKGKYPNLRYTVQCDDGLHMVQSASLLGTDDSNGLLYFKVNHTNNTLLRITGSYSEIQESNTYNKDQLDELGTQKIESWLGHLQFSTKNQEYQKLIDLAFWYTHNALVHYASPHGLEQYNGAAWGTRDVCQGPAELFMAADRYDLVRDIILLVYKRQFIENGDFPQWFMFDRYYQIQAHDSHGDIIVWPMRLLAHYLERTRDTTILDEIVPYMSLKENDFTSKKESIFDHVKLQVKALKQSSISDTSLPKYGGGDWDDTLQPANEHLKESMVSSWTVSLLYGTLNTLISGIEDTHVDFAEELAEYSAQLEKDYHQYLMKDNYPVGFTVFNNPNRQLIHPSDELTHIHYRLLPYIRSIISGLAKNDLAEKYKELIGRHLKHPDGVRLMDATVPYQGGKMTFFQRGETAANFGREIGLQYVHAHIRYVEAMYRMNQPKLGLEGLLEICPITIQDVVTNARLRQSNMYFSSSDADVKTRYEAQKKFHLLKTGDLPVKGGWRLYSSGPGIYLRQLVENMVGISRYQNMLCINTMSFDDLGLTSITSHFDKKPIKVLYKNETGNITLNGESIDVVIKTDSFGNRICLINPKLLLSDENIIMFN